MFKKDQSDLGLLQSSNLSRVVEAQPYNSYCFHFWLAPAML